MRELLGIIYGFAVSIGLFMYIWRLAHSIPEEPQDNIKEGNQ